MKARSPFFIAMIGAPLAIFLAAAALQTSCAKKSQNRALATFVVGTVTLERQGSAAAPVTHGHEFIRGDRVVTGPQSLLVIQVGEESVLQVGADTHVEISALMEGGNTRYNLDSGKVLARVRPLAKGGTYTIQTKTSIAAVRGTEFGVSLEQGRPVVAVHDGSVAVARVVDEAPRDEKVIEKGNAALVAELITTRPVTESETRDYDEFKKVPLISNIGAKTGEELKRIEEEVLNPGTPREEKKDGDLEPRDGDGEETTAETAAEEKPLVWTSKRVYASSDPIVVGYKNLPEYRNAWISIEKASAADGSYETYQWTYSAKNGSMTFPDMNLEPGTYEVRVHFGRGNAVDMRFPFSVQ
jgi:ferric-dicitrate binding protein FerR (iron transport regulator)